MATTWLSDSFTEASDLTLASHAPNTGGAWALHSAFPTAATVVAAEGRVKGTSTSSASLYTNAAAPPSADYAVAATGRCTVTGSGGVFGVCARFNATANTGYYWWYTGSNLTLTKNVAGTQTTLGTYAFTPTANTDYVLKLEVFGDKITGYLDNVAAVAVVDTAITATDRAGLLVRANGRIDGLTGATLDSTTSRLSQTVAEVLVLPPAPSPTLSQVVAEVVSVPNPNLQVYQLVAETVWAPTNPDLQLYQSVVEVIRANGSATALPGDGYERLLWGRTPTAESNDGNQYELGTRFYASMPGYVRGLRFYKAASDSGGPYVGNLWDDAGNLLASTTFTGVTGGGWYEAALAEPVALKARNYYWVSANVGTAKYWPNTPGDFYSLIDNGHLHSARDGGLTSGYSMTPGTFIQGGSSSYNFFRDVIFEPVPEVAQTILGTTAPATISASNALEWGVRFMPTVDGTLDGVRYYRVASDSRDRNANVWDDAGNLLGTVPFQDETAFGWQVAYFPTPIDLTANTYYRVSVADGYSVGYTDNAFAAPQTVGDLYVPAAAGYSNLTHDAYPDTAVSSNRNYFRDVLFKRKGGATYSVLGTEAGSAADLTAGFLLQWGSLDETLTGADTADAVAQALRQAEESAAAQDAAASLAAGGADQAETAGAADFLEVSAACLAQGADAGNAAETAGAGLDLPAQASEAASGGDSHQSIVSTLATHTEAADAQTAGGVLGGADSNVVETASAGESAGGAFIATAGQSEPGLATDRPDGGVAAVAERRESGTALDSTQSTQAATGAQAETLDAQSAPAGTTGLERGVLEAGVAGESAGGERQSSGVQVETLGSGESAGGRLDAVGTQAEPGLAQASETVAQTLLADQAEAVQANATQSGILGQLAELLEATTAEDAQAAAGQLVGALVEAVATSDTTDCVGAAVAAVQEAASAGELSASTAAFLAAVLEAAVAGDTVAALVTDPLIRTLVMVAWRVQPALIASPVVEPTAGAQFAARPALQQDALTASAVAGMDALHAEPAIAAPAPALAPERNP